MLYVITEDKQVADYVRLVFYKSCNLMVSPELCFMRIFPEIDTTKQ